MENNSGVCSLFFSFFPVPAEIKKANWLTLTDDLPGYAKFDAILCLGSSILHLVDSLPDLALYRKCLTNFKKYLKPGGLLVIDHRNIDSMLDRGTVVNKNVYHKVCYYFTIEIIQYFHQFRKCKVT